MSAFALNQVNSGIPEGGLVPKSYYMSPQDFEKDQSPGPHLTDSSCYQSISLNKSQVRHSTKQMARLVIITRGEQNSSLRHKQTCRLCTFPIKFTLEILFAQ